MKRVRRVRRRGQSMLEYTMVAHVLFVGGAVAVWPFLIYLMRGLNIYFKSIYFVLNAATP